jgi:hypothetical protein
MRKTLGLPQPQRQRVFALRNPVGDGPRHWGAHPEAAAPRSLDLARKKHQSREAGALGGRDRIATADAIFGVGNPLGQLAGGDEGRNEGRVAV